jgi:hypothetical protein
MRLRMVGTGGKQGAAIRVVWDGGETLVALPGTSSVARKRYPELRPRDDPHHWVAAELCPSVRELRCLEAWYFERRNT